MVDEIGIFFLKAQNAQHQAALVQTGLDHLSAIDYNAAGNLYASPFFELGKLFVIRRCSGENGEVRPQGFEVEVGSSGCRSSEIEMRFIDHNADKKAFIT